MAAAPRAVADPLLLPDFALTKIVEHLGLVDKLNLSLVNKASQWYFNNAAYQPEALWGTLHLVQDDSIPDQKKRIPIEGRQLLEWLRGRHRGAGFNALRADWGTPGEQYLSLHYRMPSYITALPNLETLRINAHNWSPSIEAMLRDASKRCTALTKIQLQIGDTITVVPESMPLWNWLPPGSLTLCTKMLDGDDNPQTMLQFLSTSLRSLSLGPEIWQGIDCPDLWRALGTLGALESLTMVTPSDPRMGMLRDMRQSALQALPTRAIPKLRVARLRGLAVTTPHAFAACRNAPHIELDPCRVEGLDLMHLLPYGEGRKQVDNSALKVLVLKAVVVYSPGMWQWLARCTALEKLSVWFGHECTFDDQAAAALAPLSSITQLQLVNMPAERMPTLPPMPALTALHVAPAAREYNHVLRPWLEAYPTLRKLRCTCLPKRRWNEAVPDALRDEYPPVLQLPALRDVELFAVPIEVVPHLSNLRQLTSLTVSTTKRCVLPKSWSTLQSLRSLITSKIKTDAIPNAALSHMTALSSLSMDYCNTKIFADNMTAMTALKSLCLRDCKLVRGWPSQLCKLTALTSLSLQAQRITLPSGFSAAQHIMPTFDSLPNLRLFEHLPAAYRSNEPAVPHTIKPRDLLHRRYNFAMLEVSEQLRQRGVATRIFGNMDRKELPDVDNLDYEEADQEVRNVLDVEAVGVDKMIAAVEGAAWSDETGLREQLQVVAFARRMLYDISFIDVNQMIAMGLVMGDFE